MLQFFGVYEDARQFCDWLETTEMFDTRGPVETSRWLGLERATLAKLHSPVDVTMLRRFAKSVVLTPGEPLWEMMRWVGSDLLAYLTELRKRLDFLALHGEFLDLETPHGPLCAFFLPRSEPLPAEPSAGIDRFLRGHKRGADVAGLIYPDRRGSGFGLSRHQDHPGLDFTRIANEADVHFAHARGFVAKTSANDLARLRELVAMAWAGANQNG